MLIHLTRDVAACWYTMGTLTAGALTFQSLELPWRASPLGQGGSQGVSCVPAGLYDLVLHDTEKHPHTFALVNPNLDVYHEPGDVPPHKAAYARTACLIHVANYPSELEGCCALGMRRGGPGVLESSSVALTKFKLVVPWITGHQLLIEYEPGISP